MSEPIDETGIPVPRQDINGIYNLLSKVVHYIMAGGKIPWSQDESTAIGGYPNGAEVVYNEHNYKSLVDYNTSLPTDATKWACIDYLPLTGGTMTGGISLAENNYSHRLSGSVNVFAGNTQGEGGSLLLRGTGASDNPGGFHLIAGPATSPAVSTDYCRLSGAKNGSLMWDDKHIVRSVDSVPADTNGNVMIHSVLGRAGSYHSVVPANDSWYTIAQDCLLIARVRSAWDHTSGIWYRFASQGDGVQVAGETAGGANSSGLYNFTCSVVAGVQIKMVGDLNRDLIMYY